MLILTVISASPDQLLLLAVIAPQIVEQSLSPCHPPGDIGLGHSPQILDHIDVIELRPRVEFGSPGTRLPMIQAVLESSQPITNSPSKHSRE